MFRTRSILILFIALLLCGCSIVDSLQVVPAQPTPFTWPSPTNLPAAEVVFTVRPPENTPTDADIELVLLDEVTGLVYNSQVIPMLRLEDGRWQTQLSLSVGSLQRYRYRRNEPQTATEYTAFGEQVQTRLIHVPGPLEIQDTIAAWSDTPYFGPTGRIFGRILDANQSQPLHEILVSIAGKSTFTDAEGRFQLDGLIPGLHYLTAVSINGAFRTVQQGALIAADSGTPAEIKMEAAPKVTLTFQVEVPVDTTPGAPVRLAGNLRQFGHLFRELPGGVRGTSIQIPQMVFVDQTNYLLIAELYAGSYLRYKYTLGDGIWNAERDQNGFFHTRELVVPDYDTTIADKVASWYSGQESELIQVQVPAMTPRTDNISLQLNPFIWFEPLPMWRGGENQWFFVLHGPLNVERTLSYRYCRNLQCGIADDAQTRGADPDGRQLIEGASSPIMDQVQAWSWWNPSSTATNIVAPELSIRQGFEIGIELLPAYQPNWAPMSQIAIKESAAGGANAIVFSPTWVLQRANPLPLIQFDPLYSPFRNDLTKATQDAVDLGLKPIYRPNLVLPVEELGSFDTWWESASRDSTWWSVWFEQYRSFILTHAVLAAEAGAEKLIISGPELSPAWPEGILADGSASNVPADADQRWRELIEEIREVFPGTLAIELEFRQELQEPPSFSDALDEIHVYWHAPLSRSTEATLAEMQAAAGDYLDEIALYSQALSDIPFSLSVEYLSIDGGATACAQVNNGDCIPASAFDQGSEVDPSFEVDLDEQSRALNAILLAAYDRPQITGLFVRRFNPAVMLQDQSASIYGKPAADVLWYWASGLTGTQQE
jgi:hypothetical protein